MELRIDVYRLSATPLVTGGGIVRMLDVLLVRRVEAVDFRTYVSRRTQVPVLPCIGHRLKIGSDDPVVEDVTIETSDEPPVISLQAHVESCDCDEEMTLEMVLHADYPEWEVNPARFPTRRKKHCDRTKFTDPGSSDSKVSVTLRKSLVGCDGTAVVERQFDFPCIPQIGSQVSLFDPRFDDFFTVRVTGVTFSRSGPIVTLEPESEDPAQCEVPLESMLEAHPGWDVISTDPGDPVAAEIERVNFRAWPPVDAHSEEFTQIMMPVDSLKQPFHDGKPIDEILKEFRGDVLDRLVKVNLHKLRVEGRLESLLKPTYRLSCKVVIWEPGKEKPSYEDLHHFSRVPNVGEHCQIHGESYRIASVRHTDPMMGFDALLFAVPVAPFDACTAAVRESPNEQPPQKG